MDKFTQQRVELALNSISTTLENEEKTQTNLGEFFWDKFFKKSPQLMKDSDFKIQIYGIQF